MTDDGSAQQSRGWMQRHSIAAHLIQYQKYSRLMRKRLEVKKNQQVQREHSTEPGKQKVHYLTKSITRQFISSALIY